jgi:hypothetical protein
MTAYMIVQLDKFRQRETEVTVLARVPYEQHYYRVRLPSGEVTVVNDSMLRFA